MVLIIVAVALLILMLSGTTFIALPATIAIGWLVTNLIPVEAGGVSIGLLPLVPALTLVTLLSRHIHRAVKDRVSIADLGVIAGLVLVVPLMLSGIASLMLVSASHVFDVSPPALGPLLARVLVLHLVALACGMGTKLWRALFRRYGVPSVVADDIRTARHFLARLCAMSFLVLLVLFLVHLGRQSEILAAYHDLGALGVVGLVVLSVLYLPHAILATAVALVGGEFHLGDLTFTLFGAHSSPLPPLPLLAVVPTDVPPVATVLLGIPAFLGAITAWRHRPHWASALRSGIAAGLMTLLACWLASGQLAAYGHVGALLGLTAGLVVLWLGGTGLIVVGITNAAQWWQTRATSTREEYVLDDAEQPVSAERDGEEDIELPEDIDESEESNESTEPEDPEASQSADDLEEPEEPEEPEDAGKDTEESTVAEDCGAAGVETEESEEEYSESMMEPLAEPEDEGTAESEAEEVEEPRGEDTPEGQEDKPED